MQLKLKLPGITLEPAPQLWEQFEPKAREALVQALAKAIVKILIQNAEHQSKKEENNNERQQ
jgi:hypothetical protein